MLERREPVTQCLQPITSSPEQFGSLFQKKSYEIPHLPLLEDMVQLVKQFSLLPDLRDTIFIGVQHMLETTVSLFNALIALGAQPQNMYFSGKCYSSAREIEDAVRERGIHLMPTNQPKNFGEYETYCQEGLRKMWEFCLLDIANKPVDRIVILDEGGRCLETMPGTVAFKYSLAAIEQTRGGLYSETSNFLLFPLVEVATCTVKKKLEPPLIAMAVIRGVRDILWKLTLSLQNTVFGVIGNGVIGSAVCQYLLTLGCTVCIYDAEDSAFEGLINKKLFRTENVREVFTFADVVFGCTGKDITQGIDMLNIIKKDKILISCTSEDKEFRSLLKLIASQSITVFDTLSDIACTTRNGRKLFILRGGFPVNFDRTPWNVPASKIEVTQGLLLGSCMQAIRQAVTLIDDGNTTNRGSRQMLNASIQRYVALHWMHRQEGGSCPREYFSTFQDENWIEKNSGGEHQRDMALEACFNSVTLAASPPQQGYSKL